MVRNLQLPLHAPPRPQHPPHPSPPARLHRVHRLHRLRLHLQLAPRRQDVPAGERDAHRVLGGRKGRGGGGWGEGAAGEGLEDADCGEWDARASIQCFVEGVWRLVSIQGGRDRTGADTFFWYRWDEKTKNSLVNSGLY